MQAWLLHIGERLGSVFMLRKLTLTQHAELLNPDVMLSALGRNSVPSLQIQMLEHVDCGSGRDT